MADRFFAPYFTPVNGNGDVYPGGKLFFYVTGTSTPLDTFSDDALTTPNANPVIADGAGRWPSIFLSPRPYKVIMQDADGVQIWSADPYTPAGGSPGVLFGYDTLLAATAAFIPTSKNFVSTAGYRTVGDGGGALYKRVISAPSHNGKFQSADGAWWELISNPVNPCMFGAYGDDDPAHDDTAALNSAMAFLNVELLAGDVYRATDDVVMNVPGQTLKGPGTIKLTSDAGCSLNILADRITVDGITVYTVPLVVPSFENAVNIAGNSVNFFNNRVMGYTTHNVYTTAQYVRIENNWIDGETYLVRGSAIVFEGAKHCRAHNNRLHWVRGFGIQTRLQASDISITDNKCFQPLQTMDADPAADGQTVFPFTAAHGNPLPWTARRFGVRKNGIPVAVDDRTIVQSTTDVTVTLASGATAGDIITLVFAFGLESININSQSYDILVEGNTIDGSGDSGIVTGSDYHNGEIDHLNTTPEEYPARINITGNFISNTMYASIAMTAQTPSTSITSNTCRDWSLGVFEGVYSAGIVCTGRGTVQGNTLIGNGTTTRFGVTLNGHPDIVSNGDANARFGGNQFEGTFTFARYHIPTSSTTDRKLNIILTDQPWIEYPGQIDLDTAMVGKPANTPYLSYASVSTGWVQEGTDKLGGTFSVRATNGAYAEASPLSVAALFRTNLRVEFMARNVSGDAGFLRVYSTVSGIEIGPTLPISDTTWQRYTYIVALTNADQINNTIRIRAGAGAAGVTAFQLFRISYQRIPL